jgi:cytoskeletal protein CcmA (bactofilin family)
VSVENTVDYLGYALSTTGTPLVDRAVTLKRVDTLATVASTTTDADGKWFFNDIAPSPLVKAEISAGTTPQISVKRCFSGDVWSLYVREKFVTAPAAVVGFGGPVTMAGPLTVTGGLTASGGISGDLAVGGDVTLGGDLHADSLFGASATLSGTLLVAGASTFNNTVTMTSWLEVVGAITTQDDLQVFGTSTLDGAVGMGGGAVTIDSGGVANFGSAVNFNAAVTIPFGPLGVPGGTLAAPGIAAVGDPDTGIWLPGSNDLMVVTNGLQVARAWKNGVNTQFSINGNEFYIGTTRLMINATVMTAASSATGIVRKIQVCDASGVQVGFLAVYGAAS